MFGRESKVEAVRLIKDGSVSVAQAARNLDVHENVLRKWVREFGADALLHHSDQGRQYASQHVQELLTENGVTCSMSRSGNVWE